MLPKAARIREDREFKSIFARGRSYKADLVVVYVLPRRSDLVRFGFTTVRKIKTAVERNRIKRHLREAVREHLKEVRPGLDIVVLARARAIGASSKALHAEVDKLLAKSGALLSAEHKT